MKRTLSLELFVFAMACASSAVAQSPIATDAEASFGHLRSAVKSGDILEVTENSGKDTKGKLQRLSESSMWLVVDGQLREIPSSEIRTVIRPRDSIWNGAAVGVLWGLILGGLGCDTPPNCAQPIAAGAVWGGLIGAAIDRSLGPGTKVVYVSPSDPSAITTWRVNVAVSSVFTRERKAVGLALRF